ncbi:MAG: hypothetical protein M3261_03290, partial [Thermoproteota archaeon]|nr:hypothetical protein [Thermoproteota archaeon]
DIYSQQIGRTSTYLPVPPNRTGATKLYQFTIIAEKVVLCPKVPKESFFPTSDSPLELMPLSGWLKLLKPMLS